MRTAQVVVLAIAMIALMTTPAMASPSLSVGFAAGKGRDPAVLPGETYTQAITVSVPRTDKATDVLVEVMGYGQTAADGVFALPPDKDTSPYSGRALVTPDKTSVHVEPGQTGKASLIVAVPRDVGSGGRYATLRFSTAHNGDESVGIVSQIVITMRFTIYGTPMIHTGSVVDCMSGPVVAGKPISLSAVFQNTGNHHFKLNGRVLIADPSGAITASIPVSDSGAIPGGSDRIYVDFIPSGQLNPGTYNVRWQLALEDGSLFAEASGTFEVPTSYFPPAMMNPAAAVDAVSTSAAGQTPPAITVVSGQLSNASWPVLIAIALGALVLGSAATLLISKRRR